MKTMTLRNIPEELAIALQREKRERGGSLNKIAIDLMRQSLGLIPNKKRSNGLAKLGGSWSEEEFLEFEEATAPFERVDPELWS